MLSVRDGRAGVDVNVRVQKLGEQILRIFVSRIVNGELAPGSKLPAETEIGAEFGVSKTVAREVVAALVSRRLVKVSQGRKPEVRPASEWDVFDPLIHEVQEDQDAIDSVVTSMQDVRMILEPEIAAHAAASISDEQLEELRAAKERMRELAGTPERWEADVDFHVVLAKATGNRILLHIIESLRDLMRVSVRRRADDIAARDGRARDYHEEIFQAIAAHDAEAARDAMRDHMLMTAQALSPTKGRKRKAKTS